MSKKIKFTSKIIQGEEKTQISFEAPVVIGEWKDFVTFEFEEPQNKVMNRIEVSEQKINIFAGTSTIELELEKNVNINYQTPMGTLLLKSYLEKLDIKNLNNIQFSYIMYKNKEKIGCYDINLQIKN